MGGPPPCISELRDGTVFILLRLVIVVGDRVVVTGVTIPEDVAGDVESFSIIFGGERFCG